MLKDPFDLALYQMLLYELQPRTIFEVGTKHGGSALWFRDQSWAMGLYNSVVSIDPDPSQRCYEYAQGIAFVPADIREIHPQSHFLRRIPSYPHPWLVVEDSSHQYDVVSASLGLFGPEMIAGDYLVVEDGIMATIGNEHKYDGGPNRAVAEFLEEHPEFQVDTTYCDFYGYNVTWAPNGWLKKTA
jgi:cephalosporin hydroxylase